MLGYYNYTVYLTYIGLLSSLAGICVACSGRSVSGAKTAVIFLLISGLCDLFDGKIARTKKDRTDEEKRFGIQIDSLCDVVCFGVLPAVILFSLPDVQVWQSAVGALFVLCGLIRLGYFNVTEETRQNQTNEKRSSYQGLPITSSAVAVPLLMSFGDLLDASLPFAYTCLLAVLGVCYITPFSIRKPGTKGTVVLIAAGIAILLLIILL